MTDPIGEKTQMFPRFDVAQRALAPKRKKRPTLKAWVEILGNITGIVLALFAISFIIVAGVKIMIWLVTL